jgi:hypothetical protein
VVWWFGKALKGHVNSFKLDVQNVVNRLPLCVDSVPIKVLITGSYTTAQKAAVLRHYDVRQSRVLALLQFLITRHSAYANITIDPVMLGALPVNHGPVPGMVVVDDGAGSDSSDSDSAECESGTDDTTNADSAPEMSHTFNIPRAAASGYSATAAALKDITDSASSDRSVCCIRVAVARVAGELFAGELTRVVACVRVVFAVFQVVI